MNTEHVKQFVGALKRGDDASALSLLENGQVTFNSLWLETDESRDNAPFASPLLFPAVHLVREHVVRALIRVGASINSFRERGGGGGRTVAGDAIVGSNIPALSLCIRLGANMSSVFKVGRSSQDQSLSTVGSSFDLAFMSAQPASLAFLLDEVYTARPICLSRDEVFSLSVSAGLGSHAHAHFKVLESRGFNYKKLENMKQDELAAPGSDSFADMMLACAQQSGDTKLLRYLMKGLGLVSTTERMATMNNALPAFPRHVPLRKYECAVCEAVSATTFCSACKVSRYCSKECQSRHWKIGGHKKECKQIQLRAKEAGGKGLSGEAGPS